MGGDALILESELEQGADVHACNEAMWWSACRAGHVNVMRQLLRRNEDRVEDEWRKALDLVVRSRNTKALCLLFELMDDEQHEYAFWEEIWDTIFKVWQADTIIRFVKDTTSSHVE